MKKLSIILLSGLLIYNCDSSPSKMLEKGNKYIANSEIEKAVKTYQNIIDKFPEDSSAQTAGYNIAGDRPGCRGEPPIGVEPTTRALRMRCSTS